MEIKEGIKERRSVRKYEDKPVPAEVLSSVLDAARLAPSANNRQPWKFVVVRDPQLRAKLVDVAKGQQFVGEAPVVIAGVALQPERVMTCEVPAYAVDLSIALDHITLAAVEEGLGTCWIGAFNQQEARRVLGVPDKYKIVALMPLGYPADTAGRKVRKPLEDVISYDQFAE